MSTQGTWLFFARGSLQHPTTAQRTHCSSGSYHPRCRHHVKSSVSHTQPPGPSGPRIPDLCACILPPSSTDNTTHLTGAALAQCLQNSDCILVSRHTPLECLSPPLLETLPTPCQQLKRGFGQCKRGMVDMRKRFRGNQPISVSHELEGGGPGQEGQVGGAQLYGGKPAFEPVKGRSGMEPENQM